MASTGQDRPDSAVVAEYLQGVARFLLRQLFGPEGVPWGTRLAALEKLVEELQQLLALEFLQLALQQQADRYPGAPASFRLCPSCRLALPDATPQARPLLCQHGPLLWNEPVAYCKHCRRACFPQARSLGIDLSPYSSTASATILHTAVKATSFADASADLWRLAKLDVPAKQVERLVHRVGAERVAQRDAAVAAFEELPLAQKFAVPEKVVAPELAVVMVDGGRLQIRSPEPDERPDDFPPQQPAATDTLTAVTPPAGVASTGTDGGAAAPLEAAAAAAAAPAAPRRGKHWREDKVGLLLKMHSSPQETDPCPQLPANFLDRQRIPRLARQLHEVASAKGAPFGSSTEEGEAAPAAPAGESAAVGAAPPRPAAKEEPERACYEAPEVKERQVVASRCRWPAFAVVVAALAWQQGFQGAKRKAFVGDGSSNNWELHKRFFGSFVAILDFIHALSYVYAAALAGRATEVGWSIYREWIEQVWQGQVEEVIAALAQRQAEVGLPQEGDARTSVPVVVADALRYLRNNAGRMDYPEYRKQGLPITSSLVESAVKQINRRVKGTEKFWSEEGAEAILQLRADQLSDGEPLEEFWQRRQEQASGQRRYAGSSKPDRPHGARAPRQPAEQTVSVPAT